MFSQLWPIRGCVIVAMATVTTNTCYSVRRMAGSSRDSSSTSRPSVSSMIAADIGKAINSILKRYEDEEEDDFVTQAPPRKKTKYG